MTTRLNFERSNGVPEGATGTRLERRPAPSREANRGQSAPDQTRAVSGGSGLGWGSPHALVGLFCTAAIGLGWLSRNELDLSPADGLGYGLGIAGLAMMAVLLGYSVRKRSRALRHAGAMRSWFEAHLVLGLLGPTLILYHANFGFGSANATISLACVLAVSSSGVGGRFLYGRMHRGMAGERRSVKGIRKQARAALVPIDSVLERVPVAADLITHFESVAVGHGRSPLLMPLVACLRPRAWVTKRRVLGLMSASDAGREVDAEAIAAVDEAFSQFCRAGELRIFEQLFALWHAIHVPLTIILFVSAAVHVVAVHLY